jgi:predicted flap endonuclease-1-like 5' DNA nuclease
MDPVQALAILSLGAFVTVLVTAIFYVFTVRPRLLEPVSLASVGLLDETLRDELLEQRAQVQALNEALRQHAAQLETAARSSGEEAYAGLREMLVAQRDAIDALQTLLIAQGQRLDGQDERLARLESMVVASQASTALDERLARLEGLLTAHLTPARADDASPVSSLLQQQAERLLSLSQRLDEWVMGRSRDHAQLAEHARVLAELDREMAAHASILHRLDERVGEHTTLLLTEAAERRQQASLLDRVARQVGQLVQMVGQLGAVPLRPGQDRLTDIRGIGPVYAGRLYKAGIHTFAQLAAMTPAQVKELLDEPAWRLRSIDVESWIRQAAERAAGQKDEGTP